MVTGADEEVRSLREAVRACEAHRRKHAETSNGTAVAAVLKGALAATLRTHAQQDISETQWRNRYVVLAGVLPAWDECSSEGQKGPEKECAAALNAGVDVAVRTLRASRSKNGINVQGRASPLLVRGGCIVASCS